MSRNINFNISDVSQLLIIIFPISLLFSNILSETIIFLLISIAFFSSEKKIILKQFNNLIFFSLIFVSIYFIINFFLNIDKNPSYLRSFFFIRFPLYAFSIYILLENLNLKLKKIFISWLVILIIILLDIYFQFMFGKNFLGYPSVRQGDIYRLGGFLNDELKISNLIIHFFVPVFTYLHSKLNFNKKNKIILFLFFLTTLMAVFLTGERANFITLIIFTVIYSLFTNLRNFFLVTLISTTFIFMIFSKTFEPSFNKRMTSDILSLYKKNIFQNNKKGFFYKDNHYFAHYSTALQITEDYPLFGVGLKNFRVYCDNDKYNVKIYPSFVDRKCSTHPHNFYFEILSETGIIGSLLLMTVLIFIFYNFFYKSVQKKNYFLFGNSLVLILFFLPIIPKGSFFTNWNAMIFWTIFGICLYSYNKSKI